MYMYQDLSLQPDESRAPLNIVIYIHVHVHAFILRKVMKGYEHFYYAPGRSEKNKSIIR